MGTKKKKNVYNSRQNGKNEATHFVLTNADRIKTPTLCVHFRVHQHEPYPQSTIQLKLGTNRPDYK